jgi:hypothetical protein
MTTAAVKWMAWRMHASYTTNYAATGAATNALYNSEVNHRAVMRVTVKHDLLFKTALNTDKS